MPSADPSTPEPRRADPRIAVGRHGEDLAARHLERRGFAILERRARTRWGEIDLVAHDGRTIVFCEVKTRIARGGGTPWTSLHEAKQRQVRRLAAAWLAERRERPPAEDLRFDAIGVVLDPVGRLVRLDHVEAAF